MNIKEISSALIETLDKLNAADIDDHAKLDLEILSLQLKKQLLIEGFNPLKEIGSITVADVSKLPSLIGQLDQVISDEKGRTAMVNKIAAIAKIALKAAGLPIPS
jgi:hypothetical protein